MRTQEELFWETQTARGVVLNDVQRQAVTNTGGALLLLAAPGSGKTTTIIMKIGYLLAVKGLLPARIKAVTFSRAAADEMKARFNRFFPTLPLADFSTIHSLAYEVVREYFRKNKQAYQLIEGGQHNDKRQLLRELFKNETNENITEDQMDELTTYISFLKNKLVAPEQWSKIDCSVPAAAEIMKRYEAFKSAADPLLLDYDDMLLYANEAFAQDQALLARYQQLYDYVLTDESQDTSLVQHTIIEKLVRSHGNLCVVADDDQSIYSWRGAEPAYLLQFKQAYPDAAILFMEQNYRSSPEIVETANAFIKRNKHRYNKNMFTRNQPHKPIVIRTLTDYRAQTNYLLDAIKALDPACKTAVLYRNNSSSIGLINELDRAGIPFYIKDEDKRFFSHWVVKDILNFMRLTYSDKRVDIFEQVFAKMNGYITKQQLEAVKRINNNESVFDNLRQYGSLQGYQFKQVQECQETIQRLKGAAPLAAICTIRQKLGYEKALERICERLGFRKENLLGILDTLEDMAVGLKSMADFAQRLQYLERVTKAAKNRKDCAVTLSTFHSAKGLEFDRVYMIDLVEGVIPSHNDVEQKQRGQSEAMEEAVRLFYVAMTRAKTHLELLTYKQREQAALAESQFVSAVRTIISPPAALATGGKLAKKRKTPATYDPKAIRQSNQLSVGMAVHHYSFGRGHIVALTADNVEIKFAGTVKTLSLDVCLANGFLVPA